MAKSKDAKKKAAVPDVDSPEKAAIEATAERHAEEAAKGLRCPKCHCTDLRVLWVRGEMDGSKVRKRICRNCGKGVLTRETVAGEKIH